MLEHKGESSCVAARNLFTESGEARGSHKNEGRSGSLTSSQKWGAGAAHPSSMINDTSKGRDNKKRGPKHLQELSGTSARNVVLCKPEDPAPQSSIPAVTSKAAQTNGKPVQPHKWSTSGSTI